MADRATTRSSTLTGGVEDTNHNNTWLRTSGLCIVVVGASGDLAKKKTYPSLLNLYEDGLLPTHLKIWGFARSPLTDVQLRDRLRPYLLNPAVEGSSSSQARDPQLVETFLQQCVYQSGTSYGDELAYAQMAQAMKALEEQQDEGHLATPTTPTKLQQWNRLFYFAIPPSAFAETAVAIKKTSMQREELGWTRLIVEKPFGRDLTSFEALNQTLSQHFSEDHLYRIDHYLGKELVQNLTVLRFSNVWLERIWNANDIQSVILTFKEPFGTEGRGGYFDQYGIIRDILQNHLLQVLTLLTMEAPYKIEGPNSGKAIRDSKVAILNAIKPITMDDVVLGQYEGYAGKTVW